MFARNVSIHLKPNMLSDYTRTFEKEILPLLRKQKGFKDEITFADAGGVDAIAISLWESKANAEAYNTNTYKQVLKTMARLPFSTKIFCGYTGILLKWAHQHYLIFCMIYVLS